LKTPNVLTSRTVALAVSVDTNFLSLYTGEALVLEEALSRDDGNSISRSAVPMDFMREFGPHPLFRGAMALDFVRNPDIPPINRKSTKLRIPGGK
jgi:hypothetical protein